MRGGTVVHALALPAVVAGVLVAGSNTAGAEAPSCPEGGVCLYGGTGLTGTQVSVPLRTSCVSVASLGIPAALSAVDNHGWMVLRLYSDSACTTQATPSFVRTGGGQADSITPAARSVRLLPIP